MLICLNQGNLRKTMKNNIDNDASVENNPFDFEAELLDELTGVIEIFINVADKKYWGLDAHSSIIFTVDKYCSPRDNIHHFTCLVSALHKTSVVREEIKFTKHLWSGHAPANPIWRLKNKT